MRQKRPYPIQKAPEKHTNLYIPEWRSLTETEQAVLISLAQRSIAISFWGVYGGVVEIYIDAQTDDYTSDKFLSDVAKYGGVRGVTNHYRDKGISFPAFETIEKTLEDFEKVSWVMTRIVEFPSIKIDEKTKKPKATISEKKLYYINSELYEKLKPYLLPNMR